ncbi:hypothetical protein O3M35_002261 [Rhynocoris fuscipes]|uniref:RRM domain-containing protein n=1 Tax=Rhynocoris fuscipes TaxID=488301 RepID=A0AAW1CRQ7_9HEMI
MSTLYVGNLPNEVTENEIRQLFSENSINCSGVLLKKGGYAFVDCPEQSLADRAIDKLNGESFIYLVFIIHYINNIYFILTNK